MSFEPASPISIITCEHCQGDGCQFCQQSGVYALKDDQKINFHLPDFIDFSLRKKLKKIFLIKRIVLVFTSLIIILFTWLFFS